MHTIVNLKHKDPSSLITHPTYKKQEMSLKKQTASNYKREKTQG